MTPEKRVEEIVEWFVENYYSEGGEGGIVFSTGFNGQLIEDWLRTTLTQELQKARHDIHTSLVAAVEGKRKVENVTSHVETHDNFIVRNSECVGYNQALNDTLTIINSIFKE